MVNELELSLVVCFSGQSRTSDAIIRQQSERLSSGSAEALQAMHQLKHDASDMKGAVLLGDVSGFAAILERSWLAKKRTANAVSNTHIDNLEEIARQNGALAAKVSGAGGGGFMMFVVPTERRFHLISTLNAAGAQAYPVKFTDRGSESLDRPVAHRRLRPGTITSTKRIGEVPDLLFISHRIPYPLNKGEKIRGYNLISHLSKK